MKSKLKPNDKLDSKQLSKDGCVWNYTNFLGQYFVKNCLIEGEELVYKENIMYILDDHILYKNHTESE